MKGYRDEAKDFLESASISIGDRIRIEKNGQCTQGLLMPRTEGGASNHVVLKLDNGYNIGIKVTENTKIEKLEEGREPTMGGGESEITPDPEKPDVTIIGTGGTVASKIDYRTGAVHPEFSPSEIYNSAPKTTEIANIRTETVCNVLSENMNPELWSKIGRAVGRELKEGEADGVVIAHGTDTMGYTASALSFMLQNPPKPVVLVGSQRSSDRPSSDATMNLTGAVSAAISDLGEVCVVMHGSSEDEFCLIHRGVKVRKCHTSRRDAFQTINDVPLGIIRDSEVEFLREKKGRNEDEGVEVKDGFEEKVALIKVFPGINPEVIEGLVDKGYKGIVLEGTGLGHVPQPLYPSLERASDLDVPVAMTSQCIWGRTNLRVYSTGRDLLDLGVFSLGDMLPETAYVKMMWVLDKTQNKGEVKSLMKENLAGEITPETRPDVFLKPKTSSE
ncbi:glutamyl-tRNA amidotransferase [candidate division MSBL1 archaeon SCGC-AAA259E19]|uniref:Glutamyl-tRNA(Gln) amidotransferase subunit D n=3 Tax=candidate division MSBL1 TaxID=215777 RepID=A0A133V5Q3_9EURY|nr:glutamyl-tRNA amidotransferase [candidate division MSBL1 archaeon SCGC-AAA259E19]KXB01765.1 glutamyl-tRNA amidotransferase [candidate division MSBL1 archaeon SCGC-AAA259O05]